MRGCFLAGLLAAAGALVGCGGPKPAASDGSRGSDAPSPGGPDAGADTTSDRGGAGGTADAAADADTGEAGAPAVTTIDVTTTRVTEEDDGLCSLLEAITASNTRAPVNTADCPAGTGHDRIRLMPGTYEPTVALTPTQNVEIVGTTVGEVRILASDNARGCAFDVVAAENNVKLANLTLTGAPGNRLTGACVGAGTLWLRHVRVTGFGAGGLLASAPDGAHAKITVVNSLIDGNRNPGNGGGIAFVDVGSQLFVEQSAIIDNVSDDRGGGVYGSGSRNSSNSIKNSTISGNAAPWGGGVAVELEDEGYMALYNSTIAHNHAAHAGGGIFQRAPDGTAVYTILKDDVITNNTAADDPTQANLNADWGSNFSCTFSLLAVAGLSRQPPNFGDSCRYDVTDARLGPLMNMGGPDGLPVHALLPGSAAIDAIDATNSQETIEQRDGWNDIAGDPPIGSAPGDVPAWTSFGRPHDGDGDGEALDDMGAYEVNPRWETELLAVARLSAGRHVVVTTPGGASHDAATELAADGIGASVVYVVPVAEVGIYALSAGMKTSADAGRFQISMADAAGGTYSAVGGVQDGYSETEMWRSVDPGTVVVSSLGDKFFEFRVTGKHPSSSGYQVFPDYITLTKQ